VDGGLWPAHKCNERGADDDSGMGAHDFPGIEAECLAHYVGFRPCGLQMARIMAAIECILPRIRHHVGRLHSAEPS
jgi:hypothetical protein